MNRRKKILITLSVFFCAFIFLLIYSFYPLLTYDVKYTQNVNNSIAESESPWRIVMYDRNWEVITDKMSQNWYYKHIKTNLNSEFVKALISIEDKNYYKHFGVNILSKFRAIKDNLNWKRISGASTITEQYIKNKYFKASSRNILQKLREAILALYINSTREKDNILNIYYHNAYFGNHLYWVWAAIEVYFKKESLEELSQEEIVILLSLLHNPWITSLEEKYFQNYFNQVRKRLWYNFKRTYFWKLKTKNNIDVFPFVTNLYREKPLSIFLNGKEKTQHIRTTIDKKLQQYTKEIIQQELSKLQWKNVTNAAVFAIIPLDIKIKKPHEILIYQWSKDFNAEDIDGQVDVIESRRQPGSTVKPFLYLQALESGMNPDDLLIDIESEYNSFQKWKSYMSKNYSLKEYWLVRLKKALWNSMNNASVRLASELWLENVYNFYKQYWFSFDYEPEHYWYSLVLGNAEMKLRDLVESYEKLLRKDKNKFLLQDILKNPDNRDISFWVNSILNTSIAQAVKTWTSSDFRDNWVISYHPNLVVGVWVWNNDNSSMIGVTGISWAGKIWHKLIEKAITLWYINSTEGFSPLNIEAVEQSEYCLDTRCFRKEIIYKKTGKRYYSRIADNIFSREDLQEKLSSFEEKKLSQMWIQLSE